jgi:hypothetical protein
MYIKQQQKRKYLLILIFILFSVPLISNAAPRTPTITSTSSNITLPISWLNTSGLFSRYHFLATANGNSNQFSGYAQTYQFGFQFIPDTENMFTLYVNALRNNIDSQFTTLNFTSSAQQRITEAGLWLSYTRRFIPGLDGEIFAGNGWDTYKLNQQNINAGVTQNFTPVQVYGTTSIGGVGLRIIRPVRCFTFTGNIRTFVIQVAKDGYTLFAGNNSEVVNSLTDRTYNLTENLEMEYSLFPKLRPFVNVGAIQVYHTNFSRSFNQNMMQSMGPFPTFTLDNNGYNYGGGILLNIFSAYITTQFQIFTRGQEYRSKNLFLKLSIPI